MNGTSELNPIVVLVWVVVWAVAAGTWFGRRRRRENLDPLGGWLQGGAIGVAIGLVSVFVWYMTGHGDIESWINYGIRLAIWMVIVAAIGAVATPYVYERFGLDREAAMRHGILMGLAGTLIFSLIRLYLYGNNEPSAFDIVGGVIVLGIFWVYMITPEALKNRVLGPMMSAPAVSLLFIFLGLPFAMAFMLSLTDQKLLTPPTGTTDFVGIENYQRTLGLAVVSVEPDRDEDGDIIINDEGEISYRQNERAIMRSDEYRPYEKLFEFKQGDTRHLLLARDADFYQSLLNNFKFAIIVVPLQTGLALFLAILVNQKLRFANVFRTIYFSPVVTSMAVIATVWFFLYNPDNGLINSFLDAITFGNLENPPQWFHHKDSAMISIIIMSIWQGVGFQMIIYLAGLQEIPEEMYEAAGLDGANLWQKFRYITWPQLQNTTVFIAVTTTILAFKLFTQVDVVTQFGGGPENSLTTMLMRIVNVGWRENGNVGWASAITVVFVLIVLVISIIQRRIMPSESAVE